MAARKSGSESKARERRPRSEQMRAAETEPCAQQYLGKSQSCMVSKKARKESATAAALRSSQHKEDGDGQIERLLPVGADDAATARLLPHYLGPHFQTQNTKCGAPNYGCVSI